MTRTAIVLTSAGTALVYELPGAKFVGEFTGSVGPYGTSSGEFTGCVGVAPFTELGFTHVFEHGYGILAGARRREVLPYE